MPTASVLGFAYESPITEFTVRTGPGTDFDRAPFRAARGTNNLPVLDVQPDSQETKSDFGRVYQWFELEFSDGQTGWMRGHVIGIQGDFSEFGYGVVATLTHAYLLERDIEQDAVSPGKTVEKASKQEREKTLNPLAAAAKAQREAREAENKPASEDDTPEPLQKQAMFAKPSGPPTALIKVLNVANARKGPSTVGFERVFTIPRGARVTILDVQTEKRAQHYRWFRIRYEEREAWIREDLCRYDGDTDALGLPWDLYPAPMGDRSWWVRGYNVEPHFDYSTWEHWGWDLGANPGEPVRCGPFGGRVAQSFECRKCAPDRPSTTQHGLGLGNRAVLRDEGWGFGYGHYIIVGYDWDKLPPSTQQTLSKRGYDGGTLFVMHAHLRDRLVEKGDKLKDGQAIGTCGNSGNSEAPHLHLEVRASQTARFPGWASLRDGLMNPIVLFNR